MALLAGGFKLPYKWWRIAAYASYKHEFRYGRLERPTKPMLRADVIELDRLLHQEEKEFPLAENEYGDVKDFEYFDSIEPPKKYAEMGVQTVGRFNMKKGLYK